MNIEKLNNFLIEAKKGTYANESAIRCESSRIGSKDYEYKSGKMMYHDTYFGGTNFMGCEVVYFEENPYWGMNYYGVTIDSDLNEEALDASLRPALMMVGNDDILPLRGPKEFINGVYRYTFQVDGDLENFKGEENIFKGDKLIYRLNCHGGLIKK